MLVKGLIGRMPSIYIIALLLFSIQTTANSRTFYAEGSDLMLGVGARNIALAGAVTASTGDVYSAYWNPAGLAKIESTQITISNKPTYELIPVNYLAAASTTSDFFGTGWNLSYAFAFIPRLHIYGNGTFREDEFESIFMRYALPDLAGDFTGELESKTKDYRFAFGLSPQSHHEFRAGFSIGYIDCGTEFCGVTADDPGNYTISSAGATAISFNMGLQYDFTSKFTFGFNINDINTDLDVKVIETDNSGTSEEVYHIEFPREVVFGVLWQYSSSIDISADYRHLSGKYGDYKIEFITARLGMEWKKLWENIDLQAGFLIPIKISSDKTESLDAPYFGAPSIGLSWKVDKFQLDSALFFDPVKSYQDNAPRAALELSVSYHF